MAYVITKSVEGKDGFEGPDLLVDIIFRDRVSAIAYTRMHVEKNKYQITLGEFDFPVTGNMKVTTSEKENFKCEEYQLVEVHETYSDRYDEVMKEVEVWTLDLLGRKFGGD